MVAPKAFIRATEYTPIISHGKGNEYSTGLHRVSRERYQQTRLRQKYLLCRTIQKERKGNTQRRTKAWLVSGNETAHEVSKWLNFFSFSPKKTLLTWWRALRAVKRSVSSSTYRRDVNSLTVGPIHNKGGDYIGYRVQDEMFEVQEGSCHAEAEKRGRKERNECGSWFMPEVRRYGV